MNLVKELESVSEELSRRVDEVPLLRRLFGGAIGEEEMVVFLVQTYHYVRWTQPLLVEAATRLSALGAPPMWARLFTEKSREEHKHDAWAVADAGKLGWSDVDVLSTLASPAVDAYVAYNRAIVRGNHPLSYLGTAWALEKLALDRAGRACAGLKASESARLAKATLFLRGHAEEDVGHVAELSRLLGAVSDPRDKAGIVTAARATAELYPAFFDVAYEELDAQRRARAAA
ncbi:MAG: hypothetical protein R3B70_19920 [Polyangiaceae bacterium]